MRRTVSMALFHNEKDKMDLFEWRLTKAEAGVVKWAVLGQWIQTSGLHLFLAVLLWTLVSSSINNENINITSPSESALMNGICLARGRSLVNVSSLPLFFFFDLFIYLALLNLCCCLGFSLVAVSRAFSRCGAQALERLGFSSSSSWAQ